VVIHRSPRYHNPLFPWKEVLEKYAGSVLMIGTHEEHEDLVSETGRKDVLHYETIDLLHAAAVIAGSSLFIGNQSCCFAIAEGLKHNAIQETWVEGPDCIFRRQNVRHVAGSRIEP
jgi:hypothetical protein